MEEKENYEIVGVQFKQFGKIYYFDPCGITLEEGDNAIVETSRGVEYGYVKIGNKVVPREKVFLPLRPVIRSATKDDTLRYEGNKEKEEEAKKICIDKIAEHGLVMKIVDAEYTFDNSKLLFYFTSDGRVDFRELVKDLASIFKTRIELRQIGIRDETKMTGGLGPCGRVLCCNKFLDDFGQVTIKMAKEQNLSLNSQKISGTCGRLMCCLRYEQEVYEEAIKNLPKIDSVVDTPDGVGVVCEISALAGIVKVKLRGADQSLIKPYAAETVTVISEKSGNKKQPDDNDDEDVIETEDETVESF